MKVLYLGCFCEPTTMPLINKRTKGRISVSATTFQRALLHGYDKLEYKPNYIVNVPDIGSFPMRCSSPFFPRSKFEFASMKGVNGAFFNFTYIKNTAFIVLSLRSLLNGWIYIVRKRLQYWFIL